MVLLILVNLRPGYWKQRRCKEIRDSKASKESQGTPDVVKRVGLQLEERLQSREVMADRGGIRPMAE
jgi:ribosomal protein L16/L10AE